MPLHRGIRDRANRPLSSPGNYLIGKMPHLQHGWASLGLQRILLQSLHREKPSAGMHQVEAAQINFAALCRMFPLVYICRVYNTAYTICLERRELHRLRLPLKPLQLPEISMSYKKEKTEPFIAWQEEAPEARVRESEWLPVLSLLLESPLIMIQYLCFRSRKYCEARRNQRRTGECGPSLNH